VTIAVVALGLVAAIGVGLIVTTQVLPDQLRLLTGSASADGIIVGEPRRAFCTEGCTYLAPVRFTDADGLTHTASLRVPADSGLGDPISVRYDTTDPNDATSNGWAGLIWTTAIAAAFGPLLLLGVLATVLSAGWFWMRRRRSPIEDTDPI
jgi:hypothetical protein